MWKIHAPPPPRIHVFLWLLGNAKVLTRDNLAKRRHVDDKSCLFCNETESVNHIFFECCVAKLMWEMVAEMTDLSVIADFESMAKGWLKRKSFSCLNVVSAAVVWSI
jgi:hypothetical protein